MDNFCADLPCVVTVRAVLISPGRNLTALALAVTLGAGLTGCGGDAAGPASLPRVGPASAPAGTGRPIASPAPVRPRLGPRRAAVAVVRRYYQVFNGLHRTMDAAAMSALFTADCPCRQQVRAVRKAAALDEHYVDRATVNVMRPSLQDADHAYVLVNLDTARGGLVTEAGRRVTTAAPRRGVQRVFRLVRHGRRWLISRIEAG